MSARPSLRKLHRVAGWIVAVPLVVSGLTGALLAFPEALREAATGVTVVPAGRVRPASELIAAATAAVPGERVTRLRYPADARHPLLADTAGHLVLLDPYRGTVLAVTPTGDDPVHFLMDLHTGRLLSRWGPTVAGVVAGILGLLCGTGLWLWRPVGRPGWRHVAVNLRAGRFRAAFDLHRLTGVLAAAVLLPVSVTGMAMVFDGTAKTLAHALTGENPRHVEGRPPIGPRERSPGACLATPDAAVVAAKRHAPGLEIRRLYLPMLKAPVYKVFLEPPGDTTRRQETRLTLHPVTLAVLEEDSPRTATAADRLLRWVRPLHFGTTGGSATQAVWAAAALAIPGLGMTGLLMTWWRRRRKLKPPAA